MFKLAFDIPISQEKVHHQDGILCLGSCFSDHIATKLIQYKFSVTSNPFGTIFNPASIFRILQSDLSKNRCIENAGVFFHLDTHSSISTLSEESLVSLVSKTKKTLDKAVEKTGWLVITFGTSFVYRLKKDNTIVANCHKIPQSNFSKSLLSVEEICTDYLETIRAIRQKNSNLKVLLTVSPVRHTRDGLHENNISKGILHQAIHEITKSDQQAYYFPSYEIMVDELRDYRYYKEDMIHPSEQAVNYIWDKFRSTYIQSETNAFINEWSKIQSGLQHKPFHPESEAHQKFLIALEGKILTFRHQIDVSQELEHIKSQLISQ